MQEYKGLSFEFGQVKGEAYAWNVAIIEPYVDFRSFGSRVSIVIEKLKPKYIFLAGVAGGLKDPSIGDMVIGTKAYFYEGGKETKNGFATRPRVLENKSRELLSLARRIARALPKGTNYYFGAIASGNKVLANMDSQTVKILKLHYNDTQAVEMEAYDFADASIHANVPYLNVRGISDLIEKKGEADKAGSQEMASTKVATFLERFFYHLSVPVQQEYYSAEVHYTKKLFGLIGGRVTKRAVLSFKNDFVEIRTEEEDLKLIRNVVSVKHVKMPGEFSKSWVRVIYLEEGQKQEVFFTEARLIGLGYWFGGSKKLLQYFKEFKDRQLPLKFLQ